MWSYVTEELPQLVAGQFPVDAKRQSIFGHSMGGHGALTIALKEPRRFRSLSALAPICAPMRAQWTQRAFTRYLGEDRESSEVLHLFDDTKIRTNRVSARDDCFCADKAYWGRGDTRPFLDSTWRPE